MVTGEIALGRCIQMHDGFQVDSLAAAGTSLEHEVRVPLRQLLPIFIETHDVFDFGDALTIDCFVIRPVWKRISIEVLSIKSESRHIKIVFDGRQLRLPSTWQAEV